MGVGVLLSPSARNLPHPLAITWQHSLRHFEIDTQPKRKKKKGAKKKEKKGADAKKVLHNE